MAAQETSFKLSAPHGTDIWRKPPHTNIFNAPSRMKSPIKLRELYSARVTFKGAWEYRYDQAGILLCFRGLDPGSTDSNDPKKNSWIKAGVEFYKNAPHISFVGCDRYSDWSLHPVEAGSATKPPTDTSNAEYVTIELKREADENGSAIWACQLLLNDQGEVLERFPLRECTWACANEDSEIQIGAYVARPAPATASSTRELEVDFRELSIQMA